MAEGEDATEISLAENVMREPMHPAHQHQYEARRSPTAAKAPRRLPRGSGAAR
jgi:hypothetical protein